MRIGMFFLSNVDAGGNFQQALSIITAAERSGLSRYEILVVTFSKAACERACRAGLNAIWFNYSKFSRWTDALAASEIGHVVFGALRKLGLRNIGRRLDRLLDSHAIDLAVFNEHTSLPIGIAEHHYIATVMDLCHRKWSEFPEVYRQRDFERRERMFKAVLPRALAVIVNSTTDAEMVSRFYGVSRDRIVEMPFLPSLAVRKYIAGESHVTPETVRLKYKLPDRYIFYPAQFWAHKNHVYILEAMAELLSRGIVLDAVFCGSDKGNMDIVHAYARKLGVAKYLHFLGFVQDEDIPPLYAGALALVMPTYFGPTNLPPLEAAAVGCPIIYSDFPEFRDQLKGAALYCDLSNPSSLAEHLMTLLASPDAGAGLRQEGRALVAALDFVDYGRKLAGIWDRFAYVRRRWSVPAD